MLLGSPKFLFNQIVNEDFESERNDKIPFLLTPPKKNTDGLHHKTQPIGINYLLRQLPASIALLTSITCGGRREG